MPARTRGRAKFDFRGRQFVWWVDNDRLRISSLDKKFIVAVPMLIPMGTARTLEVIGSEFPGIEPDQPRPIWLVLPEPWPNSNDLGGTANELLRWSFDEKQDRIRCEGPARP